MPVGRAKTRDCEKRDRRYQTTDCYKESQLRLNSMQMITKRIGSINSQIDARNPNRGLRASIVF
jgi:hypothetical protein